MSEMIERVAQAIIATAVPKGLEQPTVELRFSVPAKLAGYLTLLARDTMVGASVNDVAVALLSAEAERRLLAGFHTVIVPIAEPKAVPGDS